MKTLCSRSAALLILFSLLFYNFSVSAQDYQFTGGTLTTGTDLAVGAVYKFSNVKAGVDATVTITDITGGISLTTIDGGGGFDKALQPTISVPALTNGFIEMRIDFFVAGTKTPFVQAEVPISPIDIDGQFYGGLPLYEFDEIEMPNGYTYFQWAGTELDMSLFSGSWARGKNNKAVDYPGIDTLQKTVMFTTVNANIASFKVRVGADNQSNTLASRLRSLYFQKFSYPFQIVLPNRTLLNFIGNEKNNGIELKGTLSASHTFDKLIIERGNSATNMEQITEMDINGASSAAYNFTYFDANPDKSVNFYRVRLRNTSQNIYELSNVLMVKMNTDNENDFQLYNTMINQNDPSINVKSAGNFDIVLQLADMSGRMVYSTTKKLYSGTNNIDLSNFDAQRGYYILVIKNNNSVLSKKIVIL